MAKHTLSVAMCTYNGMPFLPQQLDSILAQSRLPDEMVVCDDCSQDDTLSTLEEFAKSAPFPVHIHRNETNLKSTKNFEKAIGLCTCDIIALSDQDDVWLPHKLETLVKALVDNPALCAVCSDIEVVDEQSNHLGYTLWASLGFGPDMRREFRSGKALSILTEDNYAAGMTMAFWSKYRDLFLPIPDDWVHDYWIVLLAASVGEVGLIEEPLALYRIHGKQQIGTPPPDENPKIVSQSPATDHTQNRGKRILFSILRNTVFPVRLLKRLYHNYLNRRAIAVSMHYHLQEELDNVGRSRLPIFKRILGSRYQPRREYFLYVVSPVEHIQARLNMPSSRLARIPIIARELACLRYHRYSTGALCAIRDLIY